MRVFPFIGLLLFAYFRELNENVPHTERHGAR